ncbi:MAG: hypothetical protein WA215_05395 [Candidatus Cybelea sp.]
MNISMLYCRTLTICMAAAMLVGCGGSQPPIGAPGAMAQTHAIVARFDRAKSQPVRAAAKDAWSGVLLYVATGGDVYVLSYPSGKAVGRLGVQGYSLCSDNHGNVFVVDADQAVAEYSHRGKLVQTLPIYDVPVSCSVDPTTGNLAVPTVDYDCVYIFPGARPPAQSVCDNAFEVPDMSAYDSHGNLFLDGAAPGPHFSTVPNFAELPKGATAFRNYSLGNRLRYGYYDSVNWDGTYITLSNPDTHSIYRMHIAHRATIVGATHVRGWVGGFCCGDGGQQTWLKDGMFIAQWHSGPPLAIWSYPDGGKLIKVLPPFASAGTSVDGVVLSHAPH